MVRFLLFVLVGVVSFGSAYAEVPLNMPYGVTVMSHQIYNLHMATFYICCVIGAFVFIGLVYTLVKYRKSKGAVASKEDHNIWVEIIWTAIPFLILVCLAIPATRVLMRIHDTEDATINIKIIGYQWRWEYEYLDQGITFFSSISTPKAQINGKEKPSETFLIEVDNPLVLPIHQKVRLLVTSNDVIHDWWVPELGVKQDALPGYVNENWTKIDKVGTYWGECGELCGTDHAFMPIVVKAVTQTEFDQWVASQQKNEDLSAQTDTLSTSDKPLTHEQLLVLGKKVYNDKCMVCHQKTGEGLPPTFPALKGSDIVTGALDPQIELVLWGKKGTAMQAFAPQLNDQEIAAVLTYQRHAWGNDKLNEQKKNKIYVDAKQVAKIRKKGE